MKTDKETQRYVLLVAFHYPPCSMSSGVQRSLSFSKHLPEYGWNPIVLTTNPIAYERTNVGQLDDIPDSVVVRRTAAIDAARHLSIFGRYWSRTALPDRWISWWLTAVPTGMRLIKQFNVEAIWSTYPIATSHLIGSTLAQRTGLPWVADFRDPMVEYISQTAETFPKDPRLMDARLRVEKRAVTKASRLVFCTNGARQIVVERYPTLGAGALATIPNGYDEAAFQRAERLVAQERSKRFVLLHSGTIYPGADRDPSALFGAIRILRDAGRLSVANFELRLRDPSNPEYFEQLAAKHGIVDLVNIEPPISYLEALSEMINADGLLLLQGHTSNPAIPAKFYEYLRAQRPIIALVDPNGETASILNKLRFQTVAPLNDTSSIVSLIAKFCTQTNTDNQLSLPSIEEIGNFSRDKLTSQLAEVLTDVVSERARDDDST